MSSGQQNLIDRHKQIQSLIQKYSSEVGIGNLHHNTHTEVLLQNNKQSINKMSPEECGEASIVLINEAIYLQVKIGEMLSEINWCRKVIDRLIAEKIHEYGNRYTPFNYKRELAIQDNETANKLSGVIAQIELRLDIIKGLPSKLTELAKMYGYLRKVKSQ